MSARLHGDSRYPASISVREALAEKTLFITGATGFVAKVWVVMLLSRVPKVGRLLLLVRSQKNQNAEERFFRMAWSSPAFRPLREQHGAGFLAFLKDHVEVIEGDIRQPRLGLSVEAYARLAARIDITVHMAGITEFQADPIQATSSNVHGGMHVADLAAMTASQAMVLVSSAFVAGARDGEVSETLVVDRAPLGMTFDPTEELRLLEAACVDSDRNFDDRASNGARKARIAVGVGRARALGWPNIYLYTKGLTEHLLKKREDLNLTIVRPSVVECAKAFPFAGWNEGIDTAGPLVWLLSTPYRWIPLKPENRFDVIPVDTVARGLCIVVALALKGRAQPINHLTSSVINPLIFERAIELAGLGLRLHGYHEHRGAFWQRAWTHLDGVPVEPRAHFRRLEQWRTRLRGMETFVSRFKALDGIPPLVANPLGVGARRLTNHLRNGVRTLSRIEHLLRLYEPFTCDYNYAFCADNVSSASSRLVASEEALFGFDMAMLDWRDYWIHVEVPGLMKWCAPLLEGKSVPEDPVPVSAQTRQGRLAERDLGNAHSAVL
ncbi:MAG: SDR family oxidoreductase [Myxococcales bacterium]|nr:SDR family oxidoreductase [Myxococcales bacterium]MCB9708173.1 SDR family oxidoreductase [Myxococcales bacterium]